MEPHSRRIFVGIEATTRGGIGVLDAKSNILAKHRIPMAGQPGRLDIKSVLEMLAPYYNNFDNNVLIYLTHPQLWYRSFYSLWDQDWDEIIGEFCMNYVVYRLISRETWQELFYDIRTSESRTKENCTSIRRQVISAKIFWPQIDLCPANAPDPSKRHYGVVTALLLAECARRRHIKD